MPCPACWIYVDRPAQDCAWLASERYKLSIEKVFNHRKLWRHLVAQTNQVLPVEVGREDHQLCWDEWACLESVIATINGEHIVVRQTV